jgi:hypothetical protein
VVVEGINSEDEQDIITEILACSAEVKSSASGCTVY